MKDVLLFFIDLCGYALIWAAVWSYRNKDSEIKFSSKKSIIQLVLVVTGVIILRSTV